MNFNGCSASQIQTALGDSVTYLQDSSVEVGGLRVYGTPWTRKRTHADAFTKSSKSELEDDVWNKIPSNTQILVTHCPPHRIMDNRGSLGSRSLRNAVFTRIRYRHTTVMRLALFSVFKPMTHGPEKTIPSQKLARA